MDLDDREVKMLKELVPYKVLGPTPDEIINEILRLKEENERLNKTIILLHKELDGLYNHLAIENILNGGNE